MRIASVTRYIQTVLVLGLLGGTVCAYAAPNTNCANTVQLNTGVFTGEDTKYFDTHTVVIAPHARNHRLAKKHSYHIWQHMHGKFHGSHPDSLIYGVGIAEPCMGRLHVQAALAELDGTSKPSPPVQIRAQEAVGDSFIVTVLDHNTKNKLLAVDVQRKKTSIANTAQLKRSQGMYWGNMYSNHHAAKEVTVQLAHKRLRFSIADCDFLGKVSVGAQQHFFNVKGKLTCTTGKKKQLLHGIVLVQDTSYMQLMLRSKKNQLMWYSLLYKKEQ